jgi:hypothetical protein
MNEDVEVMERSDQVPALTDAVDSSLAVGLSRAEIDTQVATAHRFPRQVSVVAKKILSLATLDEETAEECMFALARGGKPIQGPSIRFAEIVKTSYGNCRAASRVVHVDRNEKVVIAEGVFHDLETNTATRAEVRRRISDKYGRIFKDDMIVVTGNAACSIALRNAILSGVPKALWRKAFDSVQHTIAGDIKTLAETRDKAVKALANYGVTPAQIFTALGVAGIEDVTLEHIPTLRGMFSALKNGESTVEEMFSGTIPRAGSDHQKVENPLSDEQPEKVDPETGEITTAGAQTKETQAEGPDAGKEERSSDTGSAEEASAQTGTEGTAPSDSQAAGTGKTGHQGAEVQASSRTSAPVSISEYHSALLRTTQAPSLKTQNDAFWLKYEYPHDDAALKDKLTAVRAAHVERIKAKDTPEARKICQDTVKGLLG